MKRSRRVLVRAVIGVLLALAMLAAPVGLLGRLLTQPAAAAAQTRRIYPPGGGGGLDVQVEANARHHIDWNWHVDHSVASPMSYRVGPGGSHTFTYEATVTPTRQDIVQVSGTVTVTNLVDDQTKLESVEVTVGEHGKAFALRTPDAGPIGVGESRSMSFEYFVTVGGPGSTYEADRFLSRRVVKAAALAVGAGEPTQSEVWLGHGDVTTTRSDVSAELDTFDEFPGPIQLSTDGYRPAENWNGRAWVFTYSATRGVTERGDLFAHDAEGRLAVTGDAPALHPAASGPGIFPSWAVLVPSAGDVPPGWHDGQNPAALKDEAVATLTTSELLQINVASLTGAYRRDFDWHAKTTETGGLGRDAHGRSPVQYVTPGTGEQFDFRLEVRAVEREPTPLILTGKLAVTNDADIERSLDSLAVLVDGVRFDDAVVDPPSAISPGQTAKIDFRVEVHAGDLGKDKNGEAIDIYSGTRNVTAEAMFARFSESEQSHLDMSEVRPDGLNPSAAVVESIRIANGFSDGFADPRAFASRYGDNVKLDALDPTAFSVGSITPWNGEAWVFDYSVRLGRHLTGQGVSAMFASTAWVTPTTADTAVSAIEIVRVSSGQPLRLAGTFFRDTDNTATGTLTVTNYNRVGVEITAIDFGSAVDFEIILPGPRMTVPGRHTGHAGELALPVQLTFHGDPAEIGDLAVHVEWSPTLGTSGSAEGLITVQ